MLNKIEKTKRRKRAGILFIIAVILGMVETIYGFSLSLSAGFFGIFLTTCPLVMVWFVFVRKCRPLFTPSNAIL